MLLSRFDVVDLYNSLVLGVSHDVMIDVDVPRTPAAELIGSHFDSPPDVSVDHDFVIHGRHHKCVHLPQLVELVDNLVKRDLFRLGRTSSHHPLCP